MFKAVFQRQKDLPLKNCFFFFCKKTADNLKKTFVLWGCCRALAGFLGGGREMFLSLSLRSAGRQMFIRKLLHSPH
jgi:hypothetical protein